MKVLAIIAALVAVVAAGPTQRLVEAGIAGSAPITTEPISVGPAIIDPFKPIAVGPAIIDFPLPDSGAISAPSPIAVGPAIIGGATPATHKPRVSMTININPAAFDSNLVSVAGLPSPAGSAIAEPEAVSVVDTAPETVNIVDTLPVSVVETAPEAVSVVDTAPVAVGPAVEAPAPPTAVPNVTNNFFINFILNFIQGGPKDIPAPAMPEVASFPKAISIVNN